MFEVIIIFELCVLRN